MIAHRFAALAAAVAVAGILTTGTVTATSGTYTIVDLDTLGGPFSQATSINATGQVALSGSTWHWPKRVAASGSSKLG